MRNHWRKLLSLLPEKAERKYYRKFFFEEHKEWELKGKMFPASNLSKQQSLKEFQRKYQLNILVETGTYLGDTLYALLHDFEHLYSIELSEHYYWLAKKRFKKYHKIHLIQGDSGKVLKELVSSLDSAALFWLDGHYSGGRTAKGEQECPVFEELKSILSSALPHIILIDDERLFKGKNDYPTIEELKTFVNKHKPSYSLDIANDCIRLFPAS